ncbi:MAG: phosphoenolpyruvate--protein phosphotransferase [Candidatus Sedimenticola sp. (ex Thyasira tokunagai)]
MSHLCCTGIGIARGISIGRAHLLQQSRIEVIPRFIDPSEVVNEVERYRRAVNDARRQLKHARSKIPSSTRNDIVEFIDAHLLMLEDVALSSAPIEHILKEYCAAEWALQRQRNELVQVFDAMEDPYLCTRKDDVDHVVNQIQKELQQRDENNLSNISELHGKIILAVDLTPADTLLLRHQGIAAFVTEYGSPMSHTAILARSLGIPAVVGAHHITRCLKHDEELIVDGQAGVVLAGATEPILAHYRKRIQIEIEEAAELRRLIGVPAITQDGSRIQLMANIELPDDIETTSKLKADGVGLYRTEFLYMNRDSIPDEEEHYQTYRRVVEGLNGIPITIRTLDLGADKRTDQSSNEVVPGSNPALGLRAIRLCLKEPELFLPQLRAILRAAALGPIRLMVPMLSSLQEVEKLKALVSEAADSLTREGLPFSAEIPIGGMIETPAAALTADAFAKELDFLSIGTNDLIQYTLAVDRIDDEVNYLYDPLHPAVLRLIKMTIEAGERASIPVSMCGEMAGDRRYTPLLLGLGLREFSMLPGSLLEVKQLLLSLNSKELKRRTQEIMASPYSSNSAQLLSQLCPTTH